MLSDRCPELLLTMFSKHVNLWSAARTQRDLSTQRLSPLHIPHKCSCTLCCMLAKSKGSLPQETFSVLRGNEGWELKLSAWYSTRSTSGPTFVELNPVILFQKLFFLSNLVPQCHLSLTPPKHRVFTLLPPSIYLNVIHSSHSSSNPTVYRKPSRTIPAQGKRSLGIYFFFTLHWAVNHCRFLFYRIGT